MEGLWQDTLENQEKKTIMENDSTEELFSKFADDNLWDLQEIRKWEKRIDDLEGAEKEKNLDGFRSSLRNLYDDIVWSAKGESLTTIEDNRVAQNTKIEKVNSKTEYKIYIQALKTELEQTGFNSLLVSELMENLNEQLPEAGDSYRVEQIREELEAQGFTKAELEELMQNITNSAS